MIRSISVRNFQAHRRLDIDLDRVTCLVGESDRGKTAVLRALRWVCCNEPRGDAFVAHGQAFARVKATLDGGTVVTRQIGRKGNLYRIDDGEPFKAFGSNVPDEVAALFNVDPSINFQGQLEAPYLFLATPGEAARSLNRIVDLERIDSVLSRCAGELRKAKSALQVCKDRLKQAEDDCERLAWVEQAHREREALDAERTELDTERTAVDSLASAVEEATRLALVVQNAADARADAEGWASLLREVVEERERVESLAEEVEQAEGLCRRHSGCREGAGRLRAELAEATEGRCPACGSPLPS